MVWLIRSAFLHAGQLCSSAFFFGTYLQLINLPNLPHRQCASKMWVLLSSRGLGPQGSHQLINVVGNQAMGAESVTRNGLVRKLIETHFNQAFKTFIRAAKYRVWHPGSSHHSPLICLHRHIGEWWAKHLEPRSHSLQVDGGGGAERTCRNTDAGQWWHWQAEGELAKLAGGVVRLN